MCEHNIAKYIYMCVCVYIYIKIFLLPFIIFEVVENLKCSYGNTWLMLLAKPGNQGKVNSVHLTCQLVNLHEIWCGVLKNILYTICIQLKLNFYTHDFPFSMSNIPCYLSCTNSSRFTGNDLGWVLVLEVLVQLLFKINRIFH